MPVSISSPRLSLKESKKPSVCLKMLIPLNGSEIAGERGREGGGVGASSGGSREERCTKGEEGAVRGCKRHTTDGWPGGGWWWGVVDGADFGLRVDN